MRPSIIGLTGYMGSGKDAAAALLSMVGYSRLAFADAVRVECCKSADEGAWPGSMPYGMAQSLTGLTEAEVWAKPTSDRVRKLLQWWGTDYRRAQDPDYWVSATIKRVAGLTVVSDVRFPDEAAAVRERGGVIWRIVRGPLDSAGIPGHSSEVMVDSIEPDAIIANDGTLIDMAARVRALVA